MQKKGIKKYVLGVIAAIIILAALFWPLPNYIEGPGDASDLSQIVSIKNHPDKQKGMFMLTSVSIAQARPLTYLYAKLSPYYSVESDDSVTDGQNMKEYDKVQHFYMESSIGEAIYTAYKHAHRQVKRTYNGIYILSIEKKSKFYHHLRVGDVVVKIDGHQFKNADGFVNYVRKQKVGQKLTIDYKRSGKMHRVTQPLIEIANHRPGIGITLTDDVKVHTSVPIKVNPGQVGGPSGGLMFSLQIYGQLTNQDLRHGQKVAGTGTINSYGQVGEIGGIDKKIIAAKKNGAKIFLAPYLKPTKTILKYEPGHLTNYQLAKQTAKKYAPNMKVIPVETFSQAVTALQKNK
ncbi:SepM family pheromone-processing serine protease [Lentilactobacillus farraginis]|uniref:Lon-like protease with PDZ domain n=1 Tax=Lentilactobacillus farraginis DSM 18382 = JCM 14108 TaxID=1423743 RepID=X0PFN1_9LACO|nr:SepM family pheromone-processing serine protease [Lentilactobacillus farraginis]KRM01061.1 S16 family peptidase [Lentilactobacillus farraginis DSM 18382 = JCM 14108]GAF35722.1 Lon-like protease with PDZ domain [Lentilactobacillus farraginis DSM 18382 = JCM 14108]